MISIIVELNARYCGSIKIPKREYFLDHRVGTIVEMSAELDMLYFLLGWLSYYLKYFEANTVSLNVYIQMILILGWGRSNTIL